MSIQRGTVIRVQTKTRDDVFGDCMYEIVEDGLPAPEPSRAGQMDGVKCVMLGGSGPAARAGFSVIDSVFHIENDIRTGITQIVEAKEKAEALAYYNDKKLDGKPRSVSGTGCVEL